MTSYSSLAAAGALTALCAPGSGQNLLYDLTGSGNEAIDQSIGACGDVDGDGLPDFLLGLPYDGTLAQQGGEAQLRSGRDGEVLLKVFGSETYDMLGFALDGAGDVNADGIPDLLLGTGQSNASYAEVVSGADGSLLYEVTGEPGELFGSAVTGLGDADADGFDDFAVGAPHASSAKGYAKVYSGQTGASVAKISGDCMYSTFGWQLDGLGDVNGDGLPELAIGQASYDLKAACPGVIRVFDPTVGVLHAFPTEDPQFGLPSKVAGIGDVDGDALPDLLIVFPGVSSCATSSPGNLKARSGLSGDVVLEHVPVVPGCVGVIYSADGFGDLDADGRDDIALGFTKPVSGDEDDRVDLISGLDGSKLMTFESPTGAYYGNGVVGLGDLNGDGELEVGATGAGAWIQSTCPGVALKYGAACPGSGGYEPQLAPTGCPNPGQTMVFHITDGFGGQPSFLAGGIGEGSVPLAGSCALLVAPLMFVQPLGILFDFGPGWGNRDVPVLLPPGTSGAVFTLQAAHLDPGVPAGFAVTNGVRVEVE